MNPKKGNSKIVFSRIRHNLISSAVSNTIFSVLDKYLQIVPPALGI
jgi:hypothetical protein